MSWDRFRCRMFGHDWKVHRVNMTRWATLGNHHTLAGAQATCLRCGEEWDDFNPQNLPLTRRKDEPPLEPDPASS